MKVCDKQVEKLVKNNFIRVSSIYKKVQELIKKYGGENFGVNTPILAIEGLKRVIFENSLDKELIKDTRITSELMNKTPYDIVKYMAEKKLPQ